MKDKNKTGDFANVIKLRMTRKISVFKNDTGIFYFLIIFTITA